MGRSKWLLLLLIPMLFGFDTRNPFRTRGPFKAFDFTVGSVGGGGGCTDGVDCYCDTETATGDLWCEDFEANGLYGPGSDDWAANPGGSPVDRGGASYWFTNYNSHSGLQLRSSDPAPRYKAACGYSTCNGPKGDYCSTDQGNAVDGGGADCWGPGINNGTCYDIQRGNDVTAENGTITLVNGKGTSASIGSGNTHFAERIPAGSTCGFTGTKTFSHNVTTAAITQAFALSSNMGTNGPYRTAFKHMEWSGNGSSNGLTEAWHMGNIGRGDSTTDPFRPFMFATDCSGAVAGATVHVGYGAGPGSTAFRCQNGNTRMDYGVDPALYQRATNFPYGRWACHQASIDGLGSSNVTIKIWHNGTLIFHASGIDGTKLVNQYYRRAEFDSYANANANQGTSATTETVWRFHDNIHVIESATPVSCAAIGFSGT